MGPVRKSLSNPFVFALLDLSLVEIKKKLGLDPITSLRDKSRLPVMFILVTVPPTFVSASSLRHTEFGLLQWSTREIRSFARGGRPSVESASLILPNRCLTLVIIPLFCLALFMVVVTTCTLPLDRVTDAGLLTTMIGQLRSCYTLSLPRSAQDDVMTRLGSTPANTLTETLPRGTLGPTLPILLVTQDTLGLPLVTKYVVS